MNEMAYDLCVVGAGSGGVRAARLAGQAGARVAILEDRHYGGTCVNLGCIPKKLMVYASEGPELFEHATEFGWELPQGAQAPRFVWTRFLERKNAEIQRLQKIYETLLEQAGVDRFWGTASFTAPGRLQVGDQTIRAKRILIATGGEPVRPDFPGSSHAVTSEALFSLKALPKRAVLVGGGFIAIEFACILHGLGVAVELLYRGELFLRGGDEDARRHLAETLVSRGLKMRFQTDAVKLERQDTGSNTGALRLGLNTGETLETDLVLLAVGRRPRLAQLGLERIGLRPNPRGFLEVNDFFETHVPGVHALGDVVGRKALTPVATREATVFVRQHFQGQKEARMNYEAIPSAVFAQPPLASVGLSEAEAVQQHDAVRCYETSFRPLHQVFGERPEKTYLKLVVGGPTERILGVHMVGPDAPEILQGLAVACQAGLTKAQLDATVGLHPTSAEEFVTLAHGRPARRAPAAAS